MSLKAIVIGIFASLIILGILGLARLLVSAPPLAEVQIRTIDMASIPPPPPPVSDSEPLAETPPPPPSIISNVEISDPTAIQIPIANFPSDLSLPTESFHIDAAPAPLPVGKAAPKVRPSAPAARPSRKAPTSKTPTPKPRAPTPPSPMKSHYNTNELDGTPRLLRHGSAAFPSSLSRKGVSSGTVVLEVELSTSGRVSIRRVVSSSYPELVAPARRIASSARFTAPKHRGLAVKAIMRWPITIKK